MPEKERRGASASRIVAGIIVCGVFLFLGTLALKALAQKGGQMRSLSCARSIWCALQLYSGDNDGEFPSYQIKNNQITNIPVSDSNAAFAQLFPTYVQSEQLFWIKGSAFCNANGPDDMIDNPPLEPPVKTLARGENGWAYVVGLTAKSNPNLPIIADGFFDSVRHTYSRDKDQKGGVWNGKKAAVVRMDGSGSMMPIDQQSMKIPWQSNGASFDDLFAPSEANDWLQSNNQAVNPK